MGEETGACNLPPGFCFFPSDEELLHHFLRPKASLLPCHPDIIPTLNLRHFDPWDLHCKAFKGGNHWYFFSHRTENRATPNGYWKHMGVDETVKDVGVKKTLVFHIGGEAEGIKTDWIMQEYCLLDNETSSTSGINGRRPSRKKGQAKAANRWVVCRVYEAGYSVQTSRQEDGMELSCLDEIFMSFDDYDEVSLPKLVEK
ncbi:NAC domain-containing protein 104-like [Phalaenopsis equestris]|uniref:NAC domain-containing protein 104-like n=1 Tax=Phalaenopsis equestris TaxID=78828 RepID=UPI0009E2861E|nr:NAC domain-containing protein 104-like [Phalaenopsis equestris]